MDTLIAEFTLDNHEDQREAEGCETDDSDDDGASPSVAFLLFTCLNFGYGPVGM